MRTKFRINTYRGIVSSIFILFCILSLLPLSINERITDFTTELFFKIRGERKISDAIILINISDDDIKSLGKWPISRDYYSYLIHKLKMAGVKTIAIDILFQGKDPGDLKNDTTFSEFIKSAGNVCLPMYFSALKKDSSRKGNSQILSGTNPRYSNDLISKYTVSTGFSNLGNDAVIFSIPLVINTGDKLIYSFGLATISNFIEGVPEWEDDGEAIRISIPNNDLTIPVNKEGRLRLNFFGSLNKLNHYSFIEILKTLNNDENKFDFNGKLVWLTVSVAGSSNLVATPLDNILPASMIHITLAENILSRSWLIELNPVFEIILLLVMMIGGLIISNLSRKLHMMIGFIGITCILFLTALMLFSYLNIILPLFFPVAILFSSVGIFYLEKRNDQQNIYRGFIKEELRKKQYELDKIKSELQKSMHKLEQESKISGKTQMILKEREEIINRLEKETDDLRSYIIRTKPKQSLKFPDIIFGENSCMKNVLEMVEKVSSEHIPVLIVGETGTGKELVARSIHQNSPRKKSSFVAVNCGALSETLLESELFGHEKGSFTGAINRRRGRFEMADGGTLFLDEISETSPAFQSKLLRVLQESVFERVGGEQSIKVNVRVIAAANKDLTLAIEANKFRSDLYYRLNGFTITLPPLRDRTGDIPLLARHFLDLYDYKSIREISTRVIETLKNYQWPGNIRELENVIRRAAILAQSDSRSIIQLKDLPEEILTYKNFSIPGQIHKPLEEQILNMLRAYRFSHSAITQTAKTLGNKDRGTITEYLRGICFEYYVKNQFNLNNASKEISASSDDEIIDRVKNKMAQYLKNVEEAGKDQNKLKSCYKGLPQKYHPFLDEIIHSKN